MLGTRGNTLGEAAAVCTAEEKSEAAALEAAEERVGVAWTKVICDLIFFDTHVGVSGILIRVHM